MTSVRPTPPHDIDAIITDLCAPSHVRGVLVLTRDGYILRAAGQLFHDPATGAVADTSVLNAAVNGSEEGVASENDAPTYTPTQMLTVTYAKQVRKFVDVVQASVDACAEPGTPADIDKIQQHTSETGVPVDPLRLLRIRTATRELLIRPDTKYIMVTVHDPPR